MKKLFIFMLVAGIVVSNLDAAVEWTKTGTKQQKVGMVWSNNTKAQKQKLYNEYHANKGKFVGGIVGGGVDKRPSGNSWWVQRYQPVSSPVWSPGANIAAEQAIQAIKYKEAHSTDDLSLKGHRILGEE